MILLSQPTFGGLRVPLDNFRMKRAKTGSSILTPPGWFPREKGTVINSSRDRGREREPWGRLKMYNVPNGMWAHETQGRLLPKLSAHLEGTTRFGTLASDGSRTVRAIRVRRPHF